MFRLFCPGFLLFAAISQSACVIDVDPPVGQSLQRVEIDNPEPLREAQRLFLNETEFDAFVALQGDREITRFGAADLPINTHSVRKSLLSGLYGIAVDRGLIDLDDTLAELGIDEPDNPLTAIERSATLRHLLTSASGVYLEAAGETGSMKSGRPLRGQFRPGEHFYYNNWDFNVLGVVFEQQTGLTIGEALDQWIAQPVGMTVFHPEHVIYRREKNSNHPQFVIFMSASDLARFGALYVQQGRWQGREIIPPAWIEASLKPQITTGSGSPFPEYGYLWWVDGNQGTAWADGWRGQYMLIDATNRLVVVSRNDTGRDPLTLAWTILMGNDGLRSHHRQLHALMVQMVSESTSRTHQSDR
jgi:CubicO group peptidase (beta-lactamase class C family)